MGFRFRPDPKIEAQIYQEAMGLAQDEGLPNVPRDPMAEERKRKAFEALVKNPQVRTNPIPQTQNPFAERVPTPDEMAQTSAALRHAQTPAEQAPMQFQSFPDQFTPNVQPDANEAEGVQEAETQDPDMINLDEDGLRNQIMQNINKPQAAAQAPSYSPGYIDALKGSNQDNRNMAFLALLNRSANQMGQIGGKVADSSGFDQYANASRAANDQTMGAIGNIEEMRMKAQQKAGGDPNKLLMELLKLRQAKGIAEMRDKTSKEGNASRNKLAEASLAQSGRIADALAGNRDARLALDTASEYSNQGYKEKDLALREKQVNAQIEANKNKAKKANLPVGVPEAIKGRVGKIAKREAMINKIKSAYQTFSNAKSDKEKLDYGNTLIKMMNDPENPDAAGIEEANRAGANLKMARGGETLDWIFGDGDAPIGRNFEGFGKTMQNMIRTMENNQKLDKEELQKIYSANGIPSGGLTEDGSGGYSIAPGPESSGEVLQPGMKWQVNTKTGARRQVPK